MDFSTIIDTIMGLLATVLPEDVMSTISGFLSSIMG